MFLQWPPFSRKGFQQTALECAEVAARDGFTGASIDVIWDNADFHGGAKNMNVWDYTVCEGYGGPVGLRALVDECRRCKLKVIAWVPTAHLADNSPAWAQHPDWLMQLATPSKGKDGHGPVYGDLHSGFREYYRRHVAGVMLQFAFDGVWMDSHLAYAGQPRDHPNSVELASF